MKNSIYWRDRAAEARAIGDDCRMVANKMTMERIALDYDFVAAQTEVQEQLENGSLKSGRPQFLSSQAHQDRQTASR